MRAPNSHRLGVIPNRSLVRGKVVGIRPEPSGYGQAIELEIIGSESIRDLANFIRNEPGNRVSFYLSENDVDLHIGDRIEAKATFRGGPTGGRYSLLPDDIKII